MDILNLPFTHLEGKTEFIYALGFVHVIDVEHQTELLKSYFKSEAPVAVISTSQILLTNEPAAPWVDFVHANADVLKDAGVHISENRDDASVTLALYWQVESND